MARITSIGRVPGFLMVLLCAIGVATGSPGWAQSAPGPADEPQGQATAPSETALVIESDSELPDTNPNAQYEFRFRARGGVPALRWKLEKGALPPGMKLEDNGLLHGRAEHTGEFEFTLSVRDGSSPQQGVQKGFILRVRSALTINWRTPARVNGNRIDGSVDVSNTTPDDIDLTFIVVALPPNGRAVAIGYQHFVLTRGTTGMELPFGETLPHGGYVVRVDAIGEVPPKRLIYREWLQTPVPLQIAVGP